MNQSISIIIAGGLISLAIIANGFFENKQYQAEVQRCISAMNYDVNGKIIDKEGTNKYEVKWFMCAKSLK